MQSDGTAGTTTEEEKLQLLQAMPAPAALSHDKNVAQSTTTEAAKKRPLEETATDEADHPAKKPRRFEMAKQRLSKWAARLFDPNRPKGLIQSPEIIPLKDTFLSAFGKREKEHDSRHGVVFPIETAIDDTDDEDDAPVPAESASSTTTTTTTTAEATAAKSTSLFKIKITNLKFTTTEQKLEQACSKYGVVHSLNLLKDAANEKQNKGRAYCTFTTEEAATNCIENLTELDGRKLRLSTANKIAANTNNTATSDAARYYVRDLSTKCFRCGGVGHYAEACTNERLAKPCPLCSMTNHDLRDCPTKVVCFNCNLPGHAARDCTMPRGQPQRRICTICFWSGHFKEECRTFNRNVAHNALCMICGELGHFNCQEMKWYFGLRGISCSNCGRTGHSGTQCDRPRAEDCSRNEDLGQKEVERAVTWNTAEDEIMSRQARGRHQQREFEDNHDAHRNRSMPPIHRGQRQDNENSRRRQSPSRPAAHGGHQNGNDSHSARNTGHPSRLPIDQPLSAPNKHRRR